MKKFMPDIHTWFAGSNLVDICMTLWGSTLNLDNEVTKCDDILSKMVDMNDILMQYVSSPQYEEAPDGIYLNIHVQEHVYARYFA